MRRQPRSLAGGRRTVLAFADHLEPSVLLEQKAQALADQLVVVDDEDLDPLVHEVSGSHARITVPCPWPVLMSSPPPSSSTRSRICRRPTPWPPRAASSKPTPSSLIVSTALSPSPPSERLIDSARAWRTAFESPSCARRRIASSPVGARLTSCSSVVTLMPSRER